MLLATIALFSALLVLMLRVAKNNLFPPVIFTAAWLLTFLVLAVMGNRLFQIDDYAYLVFIVGGLSFSAGGVLALCAGPHQQKTLERTPDSKRMTRIGLDVLLSVLVIGFPYYVKVALNVGDASGEGLALAAIRQAVVDADGKNVWGFVAGNLNVLAALGAAAMVYETDGTWGRWWRAGIAVVLAIAYSALTGSKEGALLLLTLFFVAQLKRGRINAVAGISVFAVIAAFFISGLLIVNLYEQDFSGLGDEAEEVGSTVASYWAGAPVAFGQNVDRLGAFESSENIGRFFVETASGLGFDARAPSIYEQYTNVGPGVRTNTYTIYFSYFKDYGWAGTVVLLASLGAFLTFLWQRTLRGGSIAILMYAMLCKATVMTFYFEGFYIGLNGYIKALAVYWALYAALPTLAARQAEADEGVASLSGSREATVV